MRGETWRSTSSPIITENCPVLRANPRVPSIGSTTQARGPMPVDDEMTPEKFPRLQAACGDGRYNDKRFIAALERRQLALEVKGRPPGAKGFVLIKKRWIVERTFAWLARYRRHSKDYERNPETSEAFIYVGMTRLMVRRLARV